MASSRQTTAPASRRKGRGAGEEVLALPLFLGFEAEAVLFRLPEAERPEPDFFCVDAMIQLPFPGELNRAYKIKPMRLKMRDAKPAAQQ